MAELKLELVLVMKRSVDGFYRVSVCVFITINVI